MGPERGFANGAFVQIFRVRNIWATIGEFPGKLAIDSAWRSVPSRCGELS